MPIRRPTPGRSPIRGKEQNLNIKQLIQARKNSGKSATGAPQFPGYNTAQGIQAVRKLISEQPRVSGFKFTAGVGITTIPNVQLPGDSRVFLGLMFTGNAINNDTFTVDINNNKIINSAGISLFNIANGSSIINGYFEYTQPLTGKDTIDIEINSSAGFTGVVNLYYI